MRYLSRTQILICTLLSLVLHMNVVLADSATHNSLQGRSLSPALGIYENFSKWDTVIKLGYNPEGAPATLADSDRFLALLNESAQRWAQVSGLRFEILPYGDYIDEFALPDTPLDNIVSVTWTDSGEDFSGRAGPVRDHYDPTLQYSPYIDGSIELNSQSNWESADLALVRTLTHEIGHIIGLGHSETPNSMMFANPYNRLQYPAEDDIRAVQTLYGSSSGEHIDPASPLSMWAYQPSAIASPFKAAFLAEEEELTARAYAVPPAVDPARIQHMFKPNGHSRFPDTGVQLVMNDARDTPLNLLSQDEPDDNYLVLYSAIGSGDTTENIDIDAELILVNPLGQVNYRRDWEITCPVANSCMYSVPLNWNRSIKNVPGTWSIFIVEDNKYPIKDQLLYRTTFQVEGSQDVKNIFATSTVAAQKTEIQNNVIDDKISDDEWIQVKININNNWNANDIETELDIVLTNPDGYVYMRQLRTISCEATNRCWNGSWLLKAGEIKKIPGEWKIYLNDHQTDETLHHISFKVDTIVQYQHSPDARLVVRHTDNPNHIQVKVIADDYENDQISVLWNPMQPPEILGPNGVSEWRTLSFTGTGSKTTYIQVNDNGMRYPDNASGRAGSGFQTLLRLDVTLPLTTQDAITVTSSSSLSYREIPYLLTWLDSYTPTSNWPSPYNGVTTPADKDISVNTIARLDVANTTLHACVRIYNDGDESHLDGIEKFDINFELLNLDSGIIQVKGSRAFNESQAVNEHFQLPDCSGKFDLATGIYTDFIQIGEQLFNTEFVLSNPDKLTFSLTDASVVP